MPPIVPLRDERVGMACADAVDVDPVQVHTLRNVRPGAAKQIHAVTETNYAAENLLQVKLGPACLGVCEILPIEDQYPH